MFDHLSGHGGCIGQGSLKSQNLWIVSKKFIDDLQFAVQLPTMVSSSCDGSPRISLDSILELSPNKSIYNTTLAPKGKERGRGKKAKRVVHWRYSKGGKMIHYNHTKPSKKVSLLCGK